MRGGGLLVRAWIVRWAPVAHSPEEPQPYDLPPHSPPRPSDEPQWVRVYVRQFEERCAAIICPDDEAPPQPGQLKGIAFFGETAEQAEQQALDDLGMRVG